MSDFAESWKLWYEAQMQEQLYNRKKFSSVKPSLSPALNFDPSEEAKILRKAMKGLGTNEDDIVQILSTRTLEQRNEIEFKYQLVVGRDLFYDLKCELSGVFEKVILSLLKPLPLFLAQQIYHATKGAGTDENALIEILCTRDDDSIKTIKEAFEKKYGKSMEDVIGKDTSGSFKKILISILALCREDSASTPSEVADELCSEDVNEDTLLRITTSYTFEFLRSVFNEYFGKAGQDFMKLVEKKCSGDSKNAFKAIYLSTKNRTEYFAYALKDAMAGCCTDDWALIRIIVTRCEIDLGTIKDKYTELFQKDVIQQIKGETSGDYEKTLLNLLGYKPE